MRRMPRGMRRAYKSTGIDVAASAAASHARIDKRGKLTIKTLAAGTIKDIPANEATKRAIGAGCWLGETVRRSGAIETTCIVYRTTGKPGCKATRKVKRAIARIHDIETGEPIPAPGLTIVPIKSGNSEALAGELKRSDYLTPRNGAPARAWVQEGIIPRESTGSCGHETRVPRELAEYRESSQEANAPELHVAGSSQSPLRIDYTAGRNQPKATYGIDNRYAINDLDHADARDQPIGHRPSDDPVKTRTMKAPRLADTEY